MSRIGGTTGTAQADSSSPAANRGGFNDLDLNQFMALLITELQNQDPLNPTENKDLLQQIGQIRDIGATDQLTTTLATLRESQELVTASNLIGQQIEGLADDASNVTGEVARVTVEVDEDRSTRKVKVHVGDKTLDIKNIRTITNQA